MPYLVALVLLLLCGWSDTAHAIRGSKNASRIPMGVIGDVVPQWKKFCDIHPKECEYSYGWSENPPSKKEQWKELNQINVAINHFIKQDRDIAIYGEEDKWTLPSAALGWRGDCEDIVLMKRSELMKRGWPSTMLLVYVVWRPYYVNNVRYVEGHAVLVARLFEADYILDNMTDTIKRWDQVDYQPIALQVDWDANLWERTGVLPPMVGSN